MTVTLPACDRILLQITFRLVPAPDRREWIRYWQGELWHRRHPRSQLVCGASNLYPGLIHDALWLRFEIHRRALSGTALLCLVLLGMFALIAALPLFALMGKYHLLLGFFAANAARLLCESALVTVVSFATAARFVEHGSSVARFPKIRRNLFQASKIILVLSIAFLISSDLIQPLHASHPIAGGDHPISGIRTACIARPSLEFSG